jgi:hypothetical protein
LIQDTTVYIRVTPDSLKDVLTKFENMALTLTFNNATKTFEFTYTDPSGDVKEMCMEVRRVTARGMNVTYCKKCQTTASGSYSCNIGDDEGVFTAVVYAKLNPTKNLLVLTYENVQQIGAKLGKEGVAYSLLLMLAIIMMFIYSPTAAVLATIAGTALLGLFGIASLPYLAWISLACAGAILIATFRS